MHRIEMADHATEEQLAQATAEHAILGLVLAMERAGFSNDPERLVAGAIARVLGEFHRDHVDLGRVLDILRAMH